jgi:hypothetical protein
MTKDLTLAHNDADGASGPACDPTACVRMRAMVQERKPGKIVVSRGETKRGFWLALTTTDLKVIRAVERTLKNAGLPIVGNRVEQADQEAAAAAAAPASQSASPAGPAAGPAS